MQLRVKPSAWITISGLSPAWTLSTARNRISSSVLWSRARASRRLMPHYNQCLLTYALVNIFKVEIESRLCIWGPDTGVLARNLGLRFHLLDSICKGRSQKPAGFRSLVGSLLQFRQLVLAVLVLRVEIDAGIVGRHRVVRIARSDRARDRRRAAGVRIGIRNRTPTRALFDHRRYHPIGNRGRFQTD